MKLKAGDKVKLDESNATIFIAMRRPNAVGTVKRIEKNGRAVVQWEEFMHTQTPTRYLAKA
jgi:hypothetical protein